MGIGCPLTSDGSQFTTRERRDVTCFGTAEGLPSVSISQQSPVTRSGAGNHAIVISSFRLGIGLTKRV